LALLDNSGAIHSSTPPPKKKIKIYILLKIFPEFFYGTARSTLNDLKIARMFSLFSVKLFFINYSIELGIMRTFFNIFLKLTKIRLLMRGKK